MKTYIEERAVEVAKFMIHTNATVTSVELMVFSTAIRALR